MTDDQKAERNAKKRANRTVNFSDLVASVAASEGYIILMLNNHYIYYNKFLYIDLTMMVLHNFYIFIKKHAFSYSSYYLGYYKKERTNMNNKKGKNLAFGMYKSS